MDSLVIAGSLFAAFYAGFVCGVKFKTFDEFKATFKAWFKA